MKIDWSFWREMSLAGAMYLSFIFAGICIAQGDWTFAFIYDIIGVIGFIGFCLLFEQICKSKK